MTDAEIIKMPLTSSTAKRQRLSYGKNEASSVGCANEWLKAYLKNAEAEAIKEFAERLKTEQSFYDGQETRIYLTEKDLDNLVKEMVGE